MGGKRLFVTQERELSWSAMPRTASLAILAACITACATSRAETSAGEKSWWEQWTASERALDGLVPLRRTLEDKGLGIGGSYTTDLLGNPVGGHRQGFTYYGQLQILLAADLEKLAGWRDAYFVAGMFDAAGTNLSREYVRNYFNLTEVAIIPTVVLGPLYLEQRFFDDKLSIKAGRMGIGEDFVVMDIFDLYLGGIDGHTPVFIWNTFWSGAPTSTWAAVAKAKPSTDLTLALGAFQATKANRVIANHGLNMEFGTDDGLSIFAEAGWKTGIAFPSSHDSLPGEHKFGGYWSDWDYPQFGGGTTASTWGLYWIGQQMIWQEAAQSDQGVTLWYSFVYSEPAEVARFPFFSGAGAGWQGAFPNRPDDWILFGSYYGTMSRSFASESRSQGLGDPIYEWVLEWDYRAQMTPWLYIMPSVQWVIRPGGTGRTPNALVLGAEIGVTF